MTTSNRARACVLLFVSSLAGGCGKGLDRSPTEPVPACRDVTGSYRAAFSTSCGKSGSSIPVAVTQKACSFTATVPGLGVLTGSIARDTADVQLDFETPCAGTADGPATVSDGRIDVAFAGSQAGAACCSLVSGTLSMYR